MAAAYPSYELGSPVPLQPLLDADGRPYRWVPCTTQPAAWDEDAPMTAKISAARICRHDCPALAACAEYRDQLGPEARGVFAGQVLRRKGGAPARVPRRRPSLGPPHEVTLPMPDRVTVVGF